MVRLLQYSDIENVYDDPDRLARFAGRLRQLSGPDSIVVGTGDNTAPGVTSMVSQGRQALELFEAIDVELSTFGNHDFDYGLKATKSIVADSPQTWVNTNVYNGTGELFATEAGAVPTACRQIGATTIGFVGLTDPATPSLNPMAADLTIDDPIEAARNAVADLERNGAEQVVALSHLGSLDDRLARSTDVDVILGGHIHSPRIDRLDGTVLTRPGVNGHRVLELSFDGADWQVTEHEIDGVDPYAPLARAVRDRISAAGLDEVVGHVEEPLSRDPSIVHGGECRIGNFVADAYRWAADADVGIQNSGGIRPGPPLAGEVTIADFVSVIPFEEPVVTVELTGDELRRAFVSLRDPPVDFGEDGWWHGHVSNAEIVWDEEAGQLRAARVGGEPIDSNRTYTVATSEYLLHSEHELPAVDTHHRRDEHEIQHEALAEYARKRGIDPEIEGRIRTYDRS